MKENPLISLIIPVYNVENYIEQCLQSIMAQNFHDFEVVIVDDGSTDNSVNVIRKYLEKVPNVSLFSQVNQGVSAARNPGLSYAKGEYIWFVDPDEYEWFLMGADEKVPLKSKFVGDLFSQGHEDNIDSEYLNSIVARI